MAGRLEKINIPLDESIESCNRYIKNIGTLTLEETIKDIEIEYFLIQNTNYKELLKSNNKEKARDLALEYYMKNNDKLPIIIKNPIVLEFN